MLSSASTATRFNPHRLLGAGATQNLGVAAQVLPVSILTDSWEPVQPIQAVAARRGEVVSILTDSWEPVQRRVITELDVALHQVSILTDSWEPVQRLILSVLS